jgi:hypothetical protein
MATFGIGPAELVTMLIVALSLGGAGGLPLSMPPLPPDPVIARVAADECLFHMETAGLAAPDADTKNLTERMLADQEMREFLGLVAEQVMALVRQRAPVGPDGTEAMATLLEAALTRPMALTVEKFQPPTPEGPPQIVASLVIRVGDGGDALEKAVNWLVGSTPLFRFEAVEVGGRSWQRLQDAGPESGLVFWGINDGSFVLAVGPGALESLVGRMEDAGREVPAWKAAIEKRLPLARPSTLTYFNAGEALRIATGLPVPDRDKLVTLLEASGLGTLETVATVSGMTVEGVAAKMWLGFDGPPAGLFAPPATGIGPKQLARIPADAMLAQAWSLDLSAMLATVLGIVEATEPAVAAAFRGNLEQVRAIAGFDLDTHLLKPLGPDWTVLSVPAPGGMLPNIAVMAGVRDRATFAKTHKALLGILRNAAAAGGEVQLSIREVPYRDQTLFCLESTSPGMPIPLTPTWCLTNDSLIVTLSPQLMKMLLAHDAQTVGIDGLAEVKQALGGGQPALVGVVDPAWLLGSLCGLYEMAVPMTRGMLREQGLTIDLPQLPPSSAIMPFARPQVSTIRHEADGIVIESTGTIPLGPLTAGGGIAGVSPASTPVLVGLLLPAVQSAREAARRTAMMNNCRQVVLAMLVHESARRKFPAQAICDADGKPLLSWRVALLPYLEHGELSKQFRLDEPWDSEHNLKLLERMPAVYGDPSAPEQAARGLTTIQVLTGKGTPFAAANEAIGVAQITDGMSKTVAIVEVSPDRAVPWTKPDDLDFDPDEPLAGVGNPRRPGGLFAAGFFDGHIEMLTPDIDADEFRGLVTPGGGETRSYD